MRSGSPELNWSWTAGTQPASQRPQGVRTPFWCRGQNPGTRRTVASLHRTRAGTSTYGRCSALSAMTVESSRRLANRPGRRPPTSPPEGPRCRTNRLGLFRTRIERSDTAAATSFRDSGGTSSTSLLRSPPRRNGSTSARPHGRQASKERSQHDNVGVRTDDRHLSPRYLPSRSGRPVAAPTGTTSSLLGTRFGAPVGRRRRASFPGPARPTSGFKPRTIRSGTGLPRDLRQVSRGTEPKHHKVPRTPCTGGTRCRTRVRGRARAGCLSCRDERAQADGW